MNADMKWYAIIMLVITIGFVAIALIESRVPEIPAECKIVCETTK